MSDTDDTDILLCIPPHTFLQPTSESESSTNQHKRKRIYKKKPQNNHIETITQQVDKLTLSLEKLENLYCSEKSSGELLEDTKFSNYSLKDISNNPYDVYSSSDCSTISYLSLTSTLNMENVDNGKIQTPVKKEDKSMLCEIDAFLKSIENINPMLDLEQSSYLETPTFDKTTHKVVKKDLSTSKDANYGDTPKTQTDFTSKYSKWCADIENYSNAVEEKKIPKVIVSGDGYLKDSVPDYGFGMRDIMYSDQVSVNKKPVSQPNVSKTPSVVEPAPSVSKNNINLINREPVIEDAVVLKKSKSETLQSIQNFQKGSLNPRRRLDLNHLDDSNESSRITQSKMSKQYLPNLTSTPSTNKENYSVKLDYSDSKMHSRFFDDSNTAVTLNESNNIPKVDSRGYLFDNLNFQVENKQPQSLPSLTHLWSTEEVKPRCDVTDLQKYEEEKIRREHCERNIQELQKKILEQQQKLAIAVQVDKSKDEAINKLRNTIIVLMRKIGLEEEKYLQQINKTNTTLRMALTENEQLKQRLEQDKEETDRAHKSIHQYQEKYILMCNEKDEAIRKLQSEIDNHSAVFKTKDDLYNELKESNALVVQFNKHISESVSGMQLGMDKMAEENRKLLKDLGDAKKTVEGLEDEIALLKNEKMELNSKIAEERSRNTHLESQKTKLQTMLDGANLKYKTLEMEFESLKQQADNQREDMKTYYQKQVETIVMSKVNEFQNQLNAAESLMDNEVQNKEKEIAVQFAKQLHKVEQQHKTEISILEEKHKEEIKLYRLQLAQSSQTIDQLESNLNSYKNRRGQIAAQLHNVMENQWKEALRIITNNAHGDFSAINCSAESQSMMSNSQSTAEIKDSTSINVNNILKEMKQYEEINKIQKEMTKVNKQSERVTPSVSEGNKNALLTEEEVQNYVKLLLHKAPGISEVLGMGTSDKTKQKHSDSKNLHEDEYPTSDRNSDGYDKKFDRKSSSKRPWK